MTTSPPQRILLVDDEKFVRQLYAEVLTSAGYLVDTAEDGAVGWQKLQGENYDLVLTDNHMPKVSGVELINKLHAAKMTLPVILATATPPVDMAELQLAALLEKPFGLEDLLQAVEEALHQESQRLAAAKIKDFAKRLLAFETAMGDPAGADGSAARRACKKLRGPLSQLMGSTGFRSLMARALALANAEVLWLQGLQIMEDGSLDGLDQLEAKLDGRTVAEGEAVLVAQLLLLLVTFIGSALTQQLVRELWPEMADCNF